MPPVFAFWIFYSELSFRVGMYLVFEIEEGFQVFEAKRRSRITKNVKSLKL